MSALKLWSISLVAPIPILLGILSLPNASSTYASVSDDHARAVCWDCKDKRIIRQWHKLLWPPAPGSAYGWGDGWHDLYRQGTCLWVHGLCIVSPTEGGQSLNLQELALGISEAVASGDFAKLAVYANIPSVNLVADQSAIQVVGCDGETIAAHIPAGRQLLTAVERTAATMLDPDA